MIGEQDIEVREQLVVACQILAASGQNDFVWGHVAARASDGAGIWMKPAGLGMEEVSYQDLVLVSWGGAVLHGERRRHAEYPIHTRVMAHRSDVNASVHSHVASATSFSCLDVPLLPISHEATYFAPHGISRFTATSDLILTDDLGDAVAEALGPAAAAFLVGHGLVTVGSDIPEAVVAALLADRAADKQLTAMAAGEIVTFTSPEEALVKRSHVYPRALVQQAWEYLARSTRGP